MTTIELPFAIGEQIWWIGYGHGTERVTCPECAGTRVIEMIKGNGERVSLDCGLCSPGYDPAKGWIERHTYNFKPTPFTPRRWGVSGDEFTFSEADPEAASYSYTYAKDLFRDYDECLRRCEERNRELAQEQERREISNIASKRKSLAFSASYWSKQIQRSKRELELAQAMLARCKQPKTITADREAVRD